jgi:hypothetical protein
VSRRNSRLDPLDPDSAVAKAPPHFPVLRRWSSSRSQTAGGATPIVRACRIGAFQSRGATRIRFPSGSAARKVSPNPTS